MDITSNRRIRRQSICGNTALQVERMRSRLQQMYRISSHYLREIKRGGLDLAPEPLYARHVVRPQFGKSCIRPSHAYVAVTIKLPTRVMAQWFTFCGVL